LRVLLPSEMRAIDQHATGQLGVPGVALMENAGAAVADQVRQVAESRHATLVAVLCGPGNNGGDGFVAARRLAAYGMSVLVYAFCPQSAVAGDALTHLQWLLNSGVSVHFVDSVDQQVASGVERADVVVDALLGTGLRGVVSGLLADAIALINRTRAPVVSVDIPSGVDGATGQVSAVAVCADITVTFAYPKVGQLLYPGRGLCGKLVIADIGIPRDAVAQASGVHSQTHLIQAAAVREVLPKRTQPSHKGTYGRLVVVAGSVGMPGAASLACAGALRSGVGTVVAVVPRSIQPILHEHNVEVMSVAVDESEAGGLCLGSFGRAAEQLSQASAFVLGPGIGRDTATAQVAVRLLDAVQCRGVVDADGLVALARQHVSPSAIKAELVLTPHPGEMAAMTGVSIDAIVGDPISVCTEYAVQWKQTVVLKGATTVVGLPDGSVYLSTQGNAGLATGGTGDVLAGVIGGLLAQGASARDAAIAGVFVHGLAGELASQALGMAGMLARDVAAQVPFALQQIGSPLFGADTEC
jgi:hydroxyethylthiazole kinase-like uncharacterized protein yjeF